MPETRFSGSMLSPSVQASLLWWTAVPGSDEWNAETFAMLNLSPPLKDGRDQATNKRPAMEGQEGTILCAASCVSREE